MVASKKAAGSTAALKDSTARLNGKTAGGVKKGIAKTKQKVSAFAAAATREAAEREGDVARRRPGEARVAGRRRGAARDAAMALPAPRLSSSRRRRARRRVARRRDTPHPRSL